MTKEEKMILNELQKGIPLEKRPFLKIANKLQLSEEKIIQGIYSLQEKGYIRRFGAIVDVNQLGVKSTLVGMKVRKEDMEKVANIVSSYEGVTHNYERDHIYNLWFTLMESSHEKLEETLKEIKERTKVEMIHLPSEKKHKTNVFFKFE
ncbi:Lrp/AsnC family transcriptional regulator [Inediibacterium massiliense]|uniref:siroheme decarboxylase subunit alpha n=1 Tax=Inediibacterium massiliense TaxID=1658111 RepID=UPI0006B3FBC0|nr:Lrp/AsnC family transcriptional regulator [Inediibacterium massiliense]